MLIILEQLITSVVEKKRNNLNKQNFKVCLLENQDQGSVEKNLKIKEINKSWISSDVGRRL